MVIIRNAARGIKAIRSGALLAALSVCVYLLPATVLAAAPGIATAYRTTSLSQANCITIVEAELSRAGWYLTAEGTHITYDVVFGYTHDYSIVVRCLDYNVFIVVAGPSQTEANNYANAVYNSTMWN